MSKKNKCSAMVYSDGCRGSHQCSRAVVNVEEGKGWCRQHTPSLINAKKDLTHEKWAQERTVWELRQALDSVNNAAINLLKEADDAFLTENLRRAKASILDFERLHKQALGRLNDLSGVKA